MNKKIFFVICLLSLTLLSSGCYYGAPGGVGATNYYNLLAQGKINGTSSMLKFGLNPDIDGTQEDIWYYGGVYTGHNPTSAERISVVSNDNNDSLTGTGARTILILGLDENYNEINETIELQGTTPVLSTLSFLRANRAKVIRSGSSNVNEGTIIFRQSITTANIFGTIPPETGQTLIAAYTIPANKTGYFVSWYASMSGKVTGLNEVEIVIRPFNESWRVQEHNTIVGTGSSFIQRDYIIPKNSLSEKTDVKLRADASTVNMGVSGGFDIILIDNN